MALGGFGSFMPAPGSTTAVNDNPRSSGKGMPLGGGTVQQEPGEAYTGPRNILLGTGDPFANIPTYENDPTANPFGPDDRPNPNYVPKDQSSPFQSYPGMNPLDGFLDHYRRQGGPTRQESRDRANADLARRGLPPLDSRPRQYSPVFGQYGMMPQQPMYQPQMNPFFQGLGGYMMPQPYNPYYAMGYGAQGGYGAQSFNPYGIRALYNMFR